MAKDKRTKPCCNCKRSKVKCVYENLLPCQRCLKTGQASTCQFIPKLPSLKLPDLNSNGSSNNTNNRSENFQPFIHQQQYNNNTKLPPPPILPNSFPPQPQVHPQPRPQYHQPQQQFQQSQPLTDPWKSSIEQTLHSFDDKINSLVDLLKTNQQQQQIQQQQQYQQQVLSNSNYSQSSLPSIIPSISNITSRSETPTKRIFEDQQGYSPNKSRKLDVPRDFRDGYVTKSEANELFTFFNDKISQQLFGFEIRKLSINDLWNSCPILVCTVCTIASIHHPKLKSKSDQLQEYLRELCNSIFFENKPKNINEGFNVIIALILCSFWLSDSQMFTGLALQLAKEFKMDQPTKNKEYLKLWYLIYVLDGQQSLTFNRTPLMNNDEYSLKYSKRILIENKDLKFKDEKVIAHNDISDEEMEKLIARQKFTDLRLVSQVEYNQALNEAFRGNAWDLLVPSSFGIPSKSNIELDKWMVSWTVLLSPITNFQGAIWSTKSTLIYYNFAKMHINSKEVREMSINPNENKFPKWENNKILNNNVPKITIEQEDTDDSDESESEEEEEGEENAILVSDPLVNANIAINAAQTVLNLVINDNDILENLKYVPVHIHIMLYYAALLLINPINTNEHEYYMKLIDSLKILNSLKKKIYANLPIDTKFGNKLIASLEDIGIEKLNDIKSYVDTIEDNDIKDDFIIKVNALIESSENIEEIVDRDSGSSRSASPSLPEKISAWPGSHHGHP
ncbi:unnamed protein product [Candida verbasci]|uniref:Zn(2)-C6 fungal-type domain-containing protein n=1 Tax=Candida verbasci TaxID=1227364 RepID=A0A9W4TUC4_9ASCO|nr:unnamed protein product [Candida verbasci]